MGILRGALNGLGKGLVQKAALDWERIKQESEIEARKALVELENQNANVRLDKEIAANDQRSQRDIDARKDLTKQELEARAAEGAADRTSRETIAREGNQAAITAAGMRAAGRGGSKIIGYDADGNPIYGADDGDYKTYEQQEPVISGYKKDEATGRLIPQYERDADGKIVMIPKTVKYSGKSGSDFQGDDAIEIDDAKLEALNSKGAPKSEQPAAAPAGAAPPASGGVLKQAAQASRDPMKNVTDPIRAAAEIEKQIATLQQAMAQTKDKQTLDAFQKRMSELFRIRNELQAK